MVNSRKPGLPNYTGPNEGVALWVHHAVPVEYCTSFAGRIAYIVAQKSLEEQALRLQALTYIGADPRLAVYVMAREAYGTAKEAYDTACDVYDTAKEETYDTAKAAYDTATAAHATAWDVYVTAKKALPWRELAATHAAEVPYTESGTLDFETFNAKEEAR